jgi:hypothetical protein
MALLKNGYWRIEDFGIDSKGVKKALRDDGYYIRFPLGLERENISLPIAEFEDKTIVVVALYKNEEFRAMGALKDTYYFILNGIYSTRAEIYMSLKQLPEFADAKDL